MNLRVGTALLLGACVMALPYPSDLLVEQMLLFQKYQVGRDAVSAAGLFTENGVTHIPLGTGTVYGKAAIQADWTNFFNGLSYIEQNVTS